MEEINRLRQNMAALTRRAAVDEDFRRLCLADAAGAYQALTGHPLPERSAVRFVEPDQNMPPDQTAAAGGGLRPVRLPRYLPKTWLG